jgi:phosphoenolpyruvate phosphomutase
MSLRSRIDTTERRRKLKEALSRKQFVRIMEAHNGLSALVAQNAAVSLPDGSIREFEGFWASSLTDSAAKGYPDAEIVSWDSRLRTIQEILLVTNKPLVVDGDTGGDPTQFEYMCSTLERMGVSAVIIEDKVFPKRNSLDEAATQTLEFPQVQANKIRRGKSVLISPDFLIFARLESLIANKGVEDALERARIYLEAGADGILIHSKQKEPDEIFRFASEYAKLFPDPAGRKPLICVPTTYAQVYEETLIERGFDMVIFANQQLRSAYKAMKETCLSILEHNRGMEADALCAPVKTIFDVVGFNDITTKDKQFAPCRIEAIVLAAGTPPDPVLTAFNGLPPAAVMIKGKPLLQRQREALFNNGIHDITVVTGYRATEIRSKGVKTIENPNYRNRYILDSLFQAEACMEHGFVAVYSDVLFHEEIIGHLLKTGGDISIIVDASYKHHTGESGKPNLELVVTRCHSALRKRRLNPHDNNVVMLSRRIDPTIASHEFVGIAYFSARGAEILRQVYRDSCDQYKNEPFHDSAHFSRAGLTDMLQELIDRGFPVHALEVNNGWIEIQNQQDIQLAEEMIP